MPETRDLTVPCAVVTSINWMMHDRPCIATAYALLFTTVRLPPDPMDTRARNSCNVFMLLLAMTSGPDQAECGKEKSRQKYLEFLRCIAGM
jgi:hypothetical protein